MMGMLIYGLINSALFVLMAIGFSLSFGISGVANFAHGAFYVTGAYLAWVFLNSLGLPYIIAILLSIFITGLFGALLYRFILFRIKGLVLAEVIATFGIGVGLMELLRSIGLSGHSYKLPPFFDGSIEVFDVYVDYQRLIIVGVGAALVLFLWLFSHYTRTGLAFRGLAQNEQTALAFGIESDRTAMMSLGMGSALAAVAAITIMPLSVIQVEEGSHILILALAVGIVGGMESVIGIILAGLIFGFAQIIVATYFNPHYTMIVLLASIILVLVFKPSGLLGKFKELEERV
jgi:branched-chain amino acid transport system permease protein